MKGITMSIVRINENRWRIVARVRQGARIIQRQATCQGSMDQAEQRLQELKRAIPQEQGSLTARARTFGEALEYYKTHKDISHSRFLFDILKSQLGKVMLNNISEEFDRYFQKCRITLSNATCNRRREWVIAVLNMSVRLGWIEKNPLKYYPKLKEVPRDRILTEDERKQFVGAIQTHAPFLLPMFQFAIQVPCRRAELVNFRKADLDLINNIIRIPNGRTKGGAGIYKPIPPDMITYFRNLPPETDFLFYRKIKGRFVSLGSFQKAWDRCLEKSKISDFRLHDCRHISATNLINIGNPSQLVMQVAGWKTDMLKIYYHRDNIRAIRDLKFESGESENNRVKVV
jgi:integrase